MHLILILTPVAFAVEANLVRTQVMCVCVWKIEVVNGGLRYLDLRMDTPHLPSTL